MFFYFAQAEQKNRKLTTAICLESQSQILSTAVDKLKIDNRSYGIIYIQIIQDKS